MLPEVTTQHNPHNHGLTFALHALRLGIQALVCGFLVFRLWRILQEQKAACNLASTACCTQCQTSIPANLRFRPGWTADPLVHAVAGRPPRLLRMRRACRGFGCPERACGQKAMRSCGSASPAQRSRTADRVLAALCSTADGLSAELPSGRGFCGQHAMS